MQVSSPLERKRQHQERLFCTSARYDKSQNSEHHTAGWGWVAPSMSLLAVSQQVTDAQLSAVTKKNTGPFRNVRAKSPNDSCKRAKGQNMSKQFTNNRKVQTIGVFLLFLASPAMHAKHDRMHPQRTR